MWTPLTRRTGNWHASVTLTQAPVAPISGILTGVSPAPAGRLYGGPQPTEEELTRFRPPLVAITGRRNPLWRETLEPASQPPIPGTLVGVSPPPVGVIQAAYDSNLLSAVHAVTSEVWQEGALQGRSALETTQAATLLPSEGFSHWQAATGFAAESVTIWQVAAWATGAGLNGWRDADLHGDRTESCWQQADFVDSAGVDQWQAGTLTDHAVGNGWLGAPFLSPGRVDHWQEGMLRTQQRRDGFTDGVLRLAVELEVWQRAGHPGNAPNPGPPLPPPPVPTPWGTRLRLICALPGTHLRIGRTPCLLIADREVAVRRTYMSVNSASLVRLPDLTPLPCTAMTVETDFDSWCWGLSATLAGPDAWALVQPNPLACEVLATINGVEWKFLLDVPSTNRSFNSDRVSLKGRSRSAWLHEPYTPSSNRDEANAREMVQVAEAALANTGWTLDWQLENWVIPAGRYNSYNTPIGALMRLVQVTDDGLYTEPSLQILRAVRRWPVAAWLLDAETADLAIPESAVISLSQAPVYSQPHNGVYVSGISHGAMALVKIAGTDGALQPGEPITHELLCDETGVGARQRGLNFLSDSGAGYELDAEVLFTPEVGLVRPGLVVSIAGVKGIGRSCRISASWGGNGLTVRQSVGLERREAES